MVCLSPWGALCPPWALAKKKVCAGQKPAQTEYHPEAKLVVYGGGQVPHGTLAGPDQRL
jgi:hypothetical protein